MATAATYFDGKSARDRNVTVVAAGNSIVFSGPDVSPTSWSLSGLHPVDAPSPGQPYRLTHDNQPGARLIIRDDQFVKSLIASSPHLKGGYSKQDIGSIVGWTLGGLATVAALGYLCLTFLPDRVAKILPNDWRNKVGKEMEHSVVEGAQVCTTPAGEAALGTLIGNLAQGAPDMPPISVHIYDLNVLNAFAVPGGNIIVTRKLIEAADSPEEVAGVLAHEIGHVYHLHPEAQLVRLTGIDVLASVFTGTKGGNMTTNMAFLATLLKYSREAEKEADAYALETMQKASIDPMGLKKFFEKVLKLEGGTSKDEGAFKALGNIFATHPGTEDRIKDILPLPAGQKAIPALSPEQWKALKSMCEK